MSFEDIQCQIKEKCKMLWRFLIAIDSVDVSDSATAVLEKIVVLQVKFKKMEKFEGTSFLNMHFVLYIEALRTESLQLNHVMDIVTRTVD